MLPRNPAAFLPEARPKVKQAACSAMTHRAALVFFREFAPFLSKEF
jgi:hypothetical protein